MAVGNPYLISEIGENIKHLQILNITERKIPGIVKPALPIARRIHEEPRNGGAEVHSDSGIIVYQAFFAQNKRCGVRLEALRQFLGIQGRGKQ